MFYCVISYVDDLINILICLKSSKFFIFDYIFIPVVNSSQSILCSVLKKLSRIRWKICIEKLFTCIIRRKLNWI